jgi:hypothetical protein
MLNGKKIEDFPLRTEARQRCSPSPLLFDIIVLEDLANAIGQEKGRKAYRLGRKK